MTPLHHRQLPILCYRADPSRPSCARRCRAIAESGPLKRWCDKKGKRKSEEANLLDPYGLGFSAIAYSPSPMGFDTIEEAFSGLTLHEKQRTVEIVGCDMLERKDGSDGEREERCDGDTEKREIEKGEEGICLEIGKMENEERVESSDNDSEKIGTGDVKEKVDCDNDVVGTQKGKEMIDGESDSIKTESDSSSEKEKSEEKEQGRSTDSEGKTGDGEPMIDGVSERVGIEEEIVVENGGSERKENGEKEEDTDGSSEGKGEEKEEKKEGETILKERVKVRVQYPQRPFTADCPNYLKTGYCSYGSVCWYNHPVKKSGTISPNGDCKEGENDGDQEMNELVGRGKVPFAQSYPQREGRDDCLFYLKTGRCSYGSHCCFNHPPRTLNKLTEDIKGQNAPDGKNDPREETNWATGPSLQHTRRRPDCARYVKEGRCDNGAECNFFHHRSRRPYEFNWNLRSRWEEKLELETNFLGLPLRPGRDDCQEYITHGACQLSTACQYNHPNPDPVIDIQDADKALYRDDSLSSSEEHAAPVPSPNCSHNIKPMFIPTPKPSLAQIKQMLLPPERPDIGDGYKELQTQGSSSSSLERSIDIHGVATARSNGFGNGCELLEHPARPGEPLCPAYIKSGNCKLKSECWYDHPREQHPKDPAKYYVQSNGYNRESSTKETLNGPIMPEEGSIYPERPGEPECAYYMRFGHCKFRSACKFHHPKHLHNKTPSFLQASRSTIGNGCEEMQYPERPGEPECGYYMLHGSCKFGWNCRFHHPKSRDEKRSSQWGYRNLGPTRNFYNGPAH